MNITRMLCVVFFLSFCLGCQPPLKTDLEKEALIPYPQLVVGTHDTFIIDKVISIAFYKNHSELEQVAELLEEEWNAMNDKSIQAKKLKDRVVPKNGFYIELIDDNLSHKESYELIISKNLLHIKASTAEGIYRGWQTVKQLLLLQKYASSQGEKRSREILPTGMIIDTPNYDYRGAMLDVSRHFFGVEDVKKYIDNIALYKINHLHLHLTDDQGWRIEIQSWPNLTLHGGSTAVGGGDGGYYTQDDFKDIVEYASKKFITIVPEIDLPGHTNAALSSYPELNCDGQAPDLYTGIEVGFSSLCAHKKITFQFIDDVIREVANLTPGEYFHIGGDESLSTKESDYILMVNHAIKSVRKHNKTPVGWEEIHVADLTSPAVVQYWKDQKHIKKSLEQKVKIILSPAHKAYLDMKYDSLTSIGLKWAGYVNVKQAYEWDPSTLLMVDKKDVLGIEAPFWSETTERIGQVEFLAFPRIIGHAEKGWSINQKQSWDNYKERLIEQCKVLKGLNINYYHSPLLIQ